MTTKLEKDIDIDKTGSIILYMLCSPNGQYVALKRTRDLVLYATNMTYEILDVMKQKVIAEIEAIPYRTIQFNYFSTDSRYFWHQKGEGLIEIMDLESLKVLSLDIGGFHYIEFHPPQLFILDQNNIYITSFLDQEIIECLSFQTYLSVIKIYSQRLWLIENSDNTKFIDQERNKTLQTWKHIENPYFFQNSENKLIFIRISNSTNYCYNLQNKKLFRKIKIKLFSEIFFIQPKLQIISTMQTNSQKQPIGIRTYDLLNGKQEFESLSNDLKGLRKHQINNLLYIQLINKLRANLKEKKTIS